jgi:hypothetical protein
LAGLAFRAGDMAEALCGGESALPDPKQLAALGSHTTVSEPIACS